jgi:hypothetical protein
LRVFLPDIPCAGKADLGGLMEGGRVDGGTGVVVGRRPAAQGVMYPWHGLSQVLDHDPGNLPPGIESTVATLDATDLRRAARASAEVLATASEAAARRHPAELPSAMAAYVTRALTLGGCE